MDVPTGLDGHQPAEGAGRGRESHAVWHIDAILHARRLRAVHAGSSGLKRHASAAVPGQSPRESHGKHAHRRETLVNRNQIHVMGRPVNTNVLYCVNGDGHGVVIRSRGKSRRSIVHPDKPGHVAGSPSRPQRRVTCRRRDALLAHCSAVPFGAACVSHKAPSSSLIITLVVEAALPRASP